MPWIMVLASRETQDMSALNINQFTTMAAHINQLTTMATHINQVTTLATHINQFTTMATHVGLNLGMHLSSIPKYLILHP